MKARPSRGCCSTATALLALWCFAGFSASAWAQGRTFTADSDFDAGTLSGVNHIAVHDALQLDVTVTSLDFLWVACTARGTLVRIDAVTGAILGEYRTAPDGRSRTPSRLAVDAAGNVWAGNRSEAIGARGSVVQIGLVSGGTRVRKLAGGGFVPDPNGGYLAPPFAYCTAVDRDGDGLIRTSMGLGNLLLWPTGTDAEGGATGFVHDAEDECIRIYQRVPATNVNQVSVDASGAVWVEGYPAPNALCRLDPATGAVLASIPVSNGGYGGCIDDNGVLWSAGLGQGQLLRFDLASGVSRLVPVSQSCGLAVDSRGAVWNTMLGVNSILKLASDGSVVPGFPKPTFGSGPFAAAVTGDDNIWVSNSTGNTVTRLGNDGALRKRISVGVSPNGLTVDGHGKVWVTNQTQSTAMRIDPAGGTDGLGAVDLTVNLGTAAGPVNYGGMAAAMQVRSVASSGSWTVTVDGARPQLGWTRISWNSDEPPGTQLQIDARAAESGDALAAQTWLTVARGEDLQGRITGRFLEIRARFASDAGRQATPTLFDLTVEANHAPDCRAAIASIDVLWPPDQRLVDVRVLGSSDPDGDPVVTRITRITCDEPLAGHGRLAAEAMGVGTDVAHLAATRLGSGNGRVYQIEFTASDGQGGECTGEVSVCVPHDQGGGRDCIDDGQIYEASLLAVASPLDVRQYPNPFNPHTTIEYVMPEPGPVRIGIYDAAGRCVRVLVAEPLVAGSQRVVWDGDDARGNPVASGVYVLQVQAGAWHESRRMLLLK